MGYHPIWQNPVFFFVHHDVQKPSFLYIGEIGTRVLYENCTLGKFGLGNLHMKSLSEEYFLANGEQKQQKFPPAAGKKDFIDKEFID